MYTWKDKNTIAETTENKIDIQKLEENIATQQEYLNRLIAERDALLAVPGRPTK